MKCNDENVTRLKILVHVSELEIAEPTDASRSLLKYCAEARSELNIVQEYYAVEKPYPSKLMEQYRFLIGSKQICCRCSDSINHDGRRPCCGKERREERRVWGIRRWHGLWIIWLKHTYYMCIKCKLIPNNCRSNNLIQILDLFTSICCWCIEIKYTRFTWSQLLEYYSFFFFKNSIFPVHQLACRYSGKDKLYLLHFQKYWHNILTLILEN